VSVRSHPSSSPLHHNSTRDTWFGRAHTLTYWAWCLGSRLSITSYDVAAHDLVAEVAEGRDDYVGLALWVLAERARGASSEWASYMASLPERINTPILWDPAQRCAALLPPSSSDHTVPLVGFRLVCEARARSIRSQNLCKIKP
jgi:hypothetical protein